MKNKLKIGIIGLGTVGQGVVKVLKKFNDIEIISCAVNNLNKKRDVEVNHLTTNSMELAQNPDIDVIVEVAGGTKVLETLKEAIKNKKHIVTANKELLARHGAELFDLAKENNTTILYEAAVAGGIPIIMPIKTNLRANNFEVVSGILNGTTNYILTKMEEENLSYEDCLKKAQDLGYAETDPTGDVEGFDAMYKIAILANIVFNKRIDVNKIYKEGITKIASYDINLANELGYKIKLIAQAKKIDVNDPDSPLDIRVHPMLVPKRNALAEIKDATNAVLLKGFPVNKVMFVGLGAGEFPTASSVVGDILVIKQEDYKNQNILPIMKCAHNTYANQINIEETKNCYYLRIKANNNLGVIGKIGSECAKYKISLSSIIQRGIDKNGDATIIVITEDCLEKDMNKVIENLEKEGNTKIVNKIRVM